MELFLPSNLKVGHIPPKIESGSLLAYVGIVLAQYTEPDHVALYVVPNDDCGVSWRTVCKRKGPRTSRESVTRTHARDDSPQQTLPLCKR